MAKKSNTWFIVSMILIGVLVVGGILYFSNNDGVPQQTLFSVVDASSLERAITFQGYEIQNKILCNQASSNSCDYQGLDMVQYTLTKDGVSYKVVTADLKTSISELLVLNPEFGSCGSFTGYLDTKPTTGEFRHFNAITQIYHHTVYWESVQSGAYLYCTNNFVIMTWEPRILAMIK